MSLTLPLCPFVTLSHSSYVSPDSFCLNFQAAVQSRLDAARQLWEEREESVEVLKRLQRQLADSAEEEE